MPQRVFRQKQGPQGDGPTSAVRPPIAPAAASLRTSSRAPTSASLPNPVQHVCRPTSAPMLNRFYLFYKFFLIFFLLLSTYGVPLAAPSRQPDRSPRFVRDFRPLIPARASIRLHGRLDGRSGFPAPENRHQPSGFPSHAATGLSAVLAAEPSIQLSRRFRARNVHSNHHIHRHRPAHHEPVYNPTQQHAR